MKAAPRWIGYPASMLVVAATDRAPQALSGAHGLLRGAPAAPRRLLLRLPLAERPGVLAALLATLGFNFFFLPPLYTFTIQDPRNVAALFVFLVSGLLIGRLSALSRRRLELLETERRDLIALTQLSQGFLSDTNRETLLGVAADRLRQALVCEQVAILLADDKGELSQRIETASVSFREDIAELAFRQGNSAAFPSELGGTDIYLPIPVGLQRAGVLVARGLRASERMAEACALLLGLAVERERFLRLTLAAEETRTSEQMKSTLLAQLAHDLKTPVAARARRDRELGGRERRLRSLAARPGAAHGAFPPRHGPDGRRPPRLGRRPAATRACRLRRDRRGRRRPLRRGARGPYPRPRTAAARRAGGGRPGPAHRGARARSRERRAIFPCGVDDPGVDRRRAAGRLPACGRPGARHPACPIATASSNASSASTTRATFPEAASDCSSPAASWR